MQAIGSRTGTGQPVPSASSPNPNEVLKNELKAVLDGVKTHGEVATRTKHAQYVNPGLQIGDTLITLPLDPTQVPLIRNASRQAPFGRGDATLVDTSVRNTWEIDASGFKLINPAWKRFVTDTVKRVSQSLGIPSAGAELYKLLLYEKGSFFKAHRDSEKAPGMIATLSFCLPSWHKGGTVHLSHAGKKYVFETSRNLFDLFVLAWYADVTHEIKPIEEGYRLVLIYNIIRTTDGANSAGFLATQDQKLQGAIAKLNLHSPIPKRLLYFLEHKYSRTSLRLDQLKGRDRAVCLTLQAACTNNGWYMFLGNVTKRVSNDNDYDDDEDEYENLHGPKLAIDTVATCGGKIFASNAKLDTEDILGPDPYNRRRADSESAGEDTGNEGSTIEYRYHDSAVVIVPKDSLDQFLDHEAKMDDLVDMIIEDLKANPKDRATRERVTSFLSKAVVKDYSLSPRVLKLAWRMEDDSLFRTAVRAGFRWGNRPENGVIPALIELVKDASEKPIDWDKRFGEFVSSHSLTNLPKTLDLIQGLLDSGDLRSSFQQWRTTASLLGFETGSRPLVLDDYDGIMQLVTSQWDTVGWPQNTLLPNIRDRSDTKLLSKFICTLLQKDRKGVLDGAKDIAGNLLEASAQKLHLTRIDFYSRLRNHEDLPEYNRFTGLLNDCLLSGFYQSVGELLRLSLAAVNASPKTDPNRDWYYRPSSKINLQQNPTFAEEMLLTICKGFEENKMPPNGPARGFVRAMLEKFFLTDLPHRPQQLEGYAHEPRGCNSRSCTVCPELNAFLVSPTEWLKELSTTATMRSHLEPRLPRHLFQCTVIEMIDQQSSRRVSSRAILRVVKLGQEYQENINKYMQALQPTLNKVAPFRTEFMKNFLGTDLYDELAMPPPSQSQAGSKRPAQEGIELPAAKR